MKTSLFFTALLIKYTKCNWSQKLEGVAALLPSVTLIHERKSLKKTIIFSAEPFSTESFPISLGLKKVLKGFMKTFRSFMS